MDFLAGFDLTVITVGIICFVLGTIINMWLLCAILTSPNLRGRLRNKLVCSLFVLHLTQTMICIPMQVGITYQRRYNQVFLSCHYRSVLINLRLIQDFVEASILVSLLTIFIAQILDCNPSETLTPLTLKLTTTGIIVSPWVVSLLIVPSVMKSYYAPPAWLEDSSCLFLTAKSRQILQSLSVVAPDLLCIMLLTGAALLRCKRFSAGSSSPTRRSELIGQIDQTSVYVFAVAIAIVSGISTYLFELLDYLDVERMIFVILGNLILEDMRTILMAIPWLFLSDIKERVKTWKPWYRPAQEINLDVAYVKENSDITEDEQNECTLFIG